MQYIFSEEQLMLRDMVREFTAKEIEPRDKWMDDNGFDSQLHMKLANTGFYSLQTPREYGGAGCDFTTAIMVIREVAKGSASVALNLDSVWLGYDLVLRYGSEAQKKEYLPLADKGKRIAFALTESCGGSDATALRSTAVHTDDGWLLNGSKAWITQMDADYVIVIAKTDLSAGARGMSAFIVPHDADGLHVGSHEDKAGMRGSTTGEISFDNVRLHENALLGVEGQGFKYAMNALNTARITISAIATGLSEHGMEIARSYANERIAFGKPISELEGIQFKFADMSARVRAMELMIFDAAKAVDAGKAQIIECAQTKLLCTSWATQICLEAQQVLGGNGCSREFHVERFVRDAKMMEIAEGTTEVQRMVVGRAYLAAK